jgi:vitamin B12 transporter
MRQMRLGSPVRVEGVLQAVQLVLDKIVAQLEGVTVAARTRISGINLRGSLDWQDPKDLTTGKQLARRSKKHASFSADSSWGVLKAGAELQLSGERFDDAANRNRLGGYGLLNLYTTWQVAPDVSLLVRLDNVADANYQTVYSYNQQPRSLYLGLTWRPRF